MYRVGRRPRPLVPSLVNRLGGGHVKGAGEPAKAGFVVLAPRTDLEVVHPGHVRQLKLEVSDP